MVTEMRAYQIAKRAAERDAAMRADPDYHEGPAVYRLDTKSKYALILCPAGHLITSRKLDKTWGGSAFEADWGKPRLVQCIGALPRTGA